MRELLQALRDKLNPSSEREMAERLQHASPVAMIAAGGKLSPLDTPPHVPPEVENLADLEARLEGLRQSLATTQAKAGRRYQLPDDLHHCLDGIEAALSAEPLTWYGLEDSRDSLSHCMVVHEAAQSWNDVIVQDLLRIVRRIGELRPLLQPRQIPADQSDAKPPEPDPVIRSEQVADVAGLAEQVAALLDTADARETLDAGASELLHKQTENIKAASQLHDDEKRLPRLRTALRRMAFLTGSVITGTSAAIAASLLTAPEAAVTLAGRLQPIFDAILKFFL